MAIAFTNKATGSANNPASGQTTGSVAFQNNRLYMFALVNRGATADTTALSGGGLTWTRRVTGNQRELWSGWAASGASTGVVTLTWSGASTGLWWIIDEGTGVDTTTQIVQSSAQGAGTGTSGSATLAAFADAVNNAAYGFLTHIANETSTAEAGYTTLGNFGAALAPDAGLITEYKLGEDLTVTASWTTSSAWHSHAVEVKAAAGGGTVAGSAAAVAVLGITSAQGLGAPANAASPIRAVAAASIRASAIAAAPVRSQAAPRIGAQVQAVAVLRAQASARLGALGQAISVVRAQAQGTLSGFVMGTASAVAAVVARAVAGLRAKATASSATAGVASGSAAAPLAHGATGPWYPWEPTPPFFRGR